MISCKWSVQSGTQGLQDTYRKLGQQYGQFGQEGVTMIMPTFVEEENEIFLEVLEVEQAKAKITTSRMLDTVTDIINFDMC